MRFRPALPSAWRNSFYEILRNLAGDRRGSLECARSPRCDCIDRDFVLRQFERKRFRQADDARLEAAFIVRLPDITQRGD